MTVLGVDFSGNPDAPGLFRAGAQFGLSRAITELGTLDSSFHSDVAAMRAAGLIAGGYHWLVPQATRDVKGQVRQYLDAAGRYIEMGPFLTQLDVESRSFGAGPSPTFRDVATWIETFHVEAPGKHPIPYGGSLWRTRGFACPSNAASVLGEPFWLSNYPFRTAGLYLGEAYGRVPPETWAVTFGGWKRAKFLQFEGTVTVAGVSGSYDLNAFDGSIDELKALAQGDTVALAFYVTGPGGTFVAGSGGHELFRIDDPSVRRTMATGEKIAVGAQIRLVAPLDGHSGDRQSAVLFVGREGLPAEAALLSDGTFTPAGLSVASVTVQFSDGSTAVARIA